MIVSGCIKCNQGAQERQPVGWVRVVINANRRMPNTTAGKKELQIQSKEFYFCPNCFNEWWDK